jgi:hypothetical protein
MLYEVVAAANDECFVGAILSPDPPVGERTGGWSAFEVWRTRIWDTHGPGPRAT